MMKLFILLIISCYRTTNGCSCSDDGDVVACMDEQNLSPTQLLNVCPNNNKVVSVSLGYSVYCYSDQIYQFPNLDIFYVSGGEGSDCACYDVVLCQVTISGCECPTPTTTDGWISALSIPGDPTTVTMTNPTTTSQPLTSYYSTTAGPHQNSQSSSFITIIVILVTVLIILCIIVVLFYQLCFKNMRCRLVEQRRQLIISNATLARNLRRTAIEAHGNDIQQVMANTTDQTKMELDDVELGESNIFKADVHPDKSLVHYSSGGASVGLNHPLSSEINENWTPSGGGGTDNPTYKTPQSEAKIEGVTTRNRNRGKKLF